MSVAQERMLATTSMADIQSVNKQCCERSRAPTDSGPSSFGRTLHGATPEKSAAYGDSAINDRVRSVTDVEGLTRRIIGPYEIGTIDGHVDDRFC